MVAKRAEKCQAEEREQAIEKTRLRARKLQVARDVAQMVEATSEPESLLGDPPIQLGDLAVEEVDMAQAAIDRLRLLVGQLPLREPYPSLLAE